MKRFVTTFLGTLFLIQTVYAAEVCQVLEPEYPELGYPVSCTDSNLALDKIEGVAKRCTMTWGELCIRYTPYVTVYGVDLPKLTKALLANGYKPNGCGLPTFIQEH